MIEAFLGFGSNLENPIKQVSDGIAEFTLLPDIRLIASSRLYRTKPHGVTSQPDFINAVIRVETTLPPEQLLSHCLELEQAHYRHRNLRWGPRTLDVDILLYGTVTLTASHLTIPHPRMHEREFVVIPLLEIAPDLILPNGLSLKKLAKRFNDADLVAVDCISG